MEAAELIAQVAPPLVTDIEMPRMKATNDDALARPATRRILFSSSLESRRQSRTRMKEGGFVLTKPVQKNNSHVARVAGSGRAAASGLRARIGSGLAMEPPRKKYAADCGRFRIQRKVLEKSFAATQMEVGGRPRMAVRL